MVDLPHAVELVAKQVQKHDEIGLQLRRDLSKPQLVALEHAPIGLLGLQKRRRHTRIQVGARPVAHDRLARSFERIGEQVRDGSLAVCPHDHDRPFAQTWPQVG